MRKTVLWCLLAALLVVGLAADSYAVLYTCQVNAVGVEDGIIYVYLTDDVNATFIEQRFLLGAATNPDAKKYFATALDAIGSTFNVQANLDVATLAVITDVAYPFAGLLVISSEFTP